MTDNWFAENEREQIAKIDYWEASRTWLKERGYFLYKNVDKNDRKYAYAEPMLEYPDTPKMRFHGDVEDPFPYAFMGPGKSIKGDRPYSTCHRFAGDATFAQDDKGRHLAIKRLKNAEEYNVLRLLKDQPRLQDPVLFPSVIPILDLFKHEGHWFAVMPRWNVCQNHTTFFPTFQSAIKYLINLLEGLVFLHELRIFHRDISPFNTLVNHISGSWFAEETRYHGYLRSIGVLRYAIMDFDLAMILDEKTYGPNPRLPIHLVPNISRDETMPYEAMHGYVDFDPFKYDVACLGILFSDEFHPIIPAIPMLAPLIDRMTTSNIDKRFTAPEALAFARTILSTISPLGHFEGKPKRGDPSHLVDRWIGLPESFVAEYGSYRDHNTRWCMRLQNWLFFDTTWGWHLMYYSRYTLRVLTYIPRLILRTCRASQ